MGTASQGRDVGISLPELDDADVRPGPSGAGAPAAGEGPPGGGDPMQHRY